MGAERALSSDGQNMDPKDEHQIREGVRQGDARAAKHEGQPRQLLAPALM